MKRDEIVRRDKQFLWHPYTPMEAYIAEVDPIVVASAVRSPESRTNRAYGWPRSCARSRRRGYRASSTPTTARPQSRSR